MRLSKYLSGCGISRRKADTLIKSGSVSVNGKQIFDPWFRVSESDNISIGNKATRINTDKIYIMLNKPRGVVCSCSDEHAEITVTDIVKIRGVRLFPVGRLDKDSEGLLILTNDGDFAHKLTHPSYGVTKTYTVHTDAAITDEKIKILLRGFRDDGEFIKALKIIKKAEKYYIFIMSEGRKREIRRLLYRVGIKVKRLRRTAIGKLKLDKQLPAGRWRNLSLEELKTCFADKNKISTETARTHN